MKKMHSSSENWTEKKWKESFENLKEEGYKEGHIKYAEWWIAKQEPWQTAVLIHHYMYKIDKETEKALRFSIVNEYGNENFVWFPKSVLIEY